MSDSIIQKVQHTYTRKDLPEFNPGDTIKVHIKIIEGSKTRIQIFQGIVIAKRGCGTDRTFTVRKIASGSIGVERVFPINATVIENIDVIRRGRVRRAKLYYLRSKIGKAARVRELRTSQRKSEKI